MQIVINLSEEDYRIYANDDWNIPLCLSDALRNGTPLPKGHGALIDESRLRERFHGVDDAGTFIYVDKLLKEIGNAPTIIPADTAD